MLQWLLLSFLTNCMLEPSKWIYLSHQTPSCVGQLHWPQLLQSSRTWVDPIIQSYRRQKLYSGNLFTSEILVGRERGLSGGGSECERNTNPTSEGVLYCVCIFFTDSIKCVSQCYEEEKVKILNLLWHLDHNRYKTQVLTRIKYFRCTCKGKSPAEQFEFCTRDVQRNLLPVLDMSIY